MTPRPVTKPAAAALRALAATSDAGVALLAGPKGAGKTIAAQALADQRGSDLQRVDLAQVVSPHLGETEKNLDRVFETAEARPTVLLFGEADALFGKRTEIGDAHDRYANAAAGYLLQKLEAHRGLAIFTTNHRQALDEAFVRRLRHVVDFPPPTDGD